jgi:cytochrome P450
MQDIIGQKTDVEFEDLKKLVKLNAFLLECLRLRTPAVGLVPRIAKEDHYIGNIFVKKGNR